MNTKTLTVTQSTPVQFLTGSAVIKRVIASSTVATMQIQLLDQMTGTQSGPGANVVLKNEISNFANNKTAIKDCQNMNRDYTYVGVGYGTNTTITSGTASPSNSLVVRANQAERAVTYVSSTGVWAIASGGVSTDTITLTIDYEGNLPPIV